MERLAIGRQPLNLERIAALLGSEPDAGADGAVVTFLGLVRNHNLGRSVRYLEYEAYEPLAVKAFERIDNEQRARWPGVRLALHCPKCSQMHVFTEQDVAAEEPVPA